MRSGRRLLGADSRRPPGKFAGFGALPKALNLLNRYIPGIINPAAPDSGGFAVRALLTPAPARSPGLANQA